MPSGGELLHIFPTGNHLRTSHVGGARHRSRESFALLRYRQSLKKRRCRRQTQNEWTPAILRAMDHTNQRFSVPDYDCALDHARRSAAAASGGSSMARTNSAFEAGASSARSLDKKAESLRSHYRKRLVELPLARERLAQLTAVSTVTGHTTSVRDEA